MVVLCQQRKLNKVYSQVALVEISEYRVHFTNSGYERMSAVVHGPQRNGH